MFKLFSLILLVSLQSAHAKQPADYFDHAVQLAENVWVGRQPKQNEMQSIRARGIDNVVSVSTAKELRKNELNEASSFAELEIGYIWLELGKRKSFSPEKLAEFNDMLLPKSGEKIIIYSKNFERAKQLMASWLCKYANTTIAAALEKVESKYELIPQNMMALLGLGDNKTVNLATG